MRGQVLGVDARTGEGQVAGDDGRRYVFGPEDWAHRGGPSIGATVDFETEGNRALSLFPLPGAAALATRPDADRPAAASDRNQYVAALLAFFLGVLGVHRFYLGRNGSGAAMLILTLTGLGLIATLPWSIIDCLRYLFMPEREFARRYARLVP